MLRYVFIMIFYFCSLGISKTQDCIEYPAIDGAACPSCTAPGWSPILTPDLTDPADACTPISPSPSGGVAAHFGVQTNSSEGMSTTVSGLEVGHTYALLFWYYSDDCTVFGSGCCASLNIYVDGASYVFPPSSGWSLAELCVTATSSSMDLDILGITTTNTHLYVDFADCSEASTECCVPEESSFDLDPQYCESYGTINLPTTSIEGVPGSWNIPSINTITSGGQTFNLEFTPDDRCDIPFLINIEILRYLVPSFSFPLEYCRTRKDEILLPYISENMISGSWSENDIDPNDWAQNNLTVDFTPFNLLCTESVSVDLFFNEGEALTFNLTDTLCQIDNPYTLPLISNEGITGNWDIAVIDFNLHKDSIEVQFQSSSECYQLYTHTFFLPDSNQISFDKISHLCKNSGLLVFDSISDQGLLGSWDIPFINTDTLSVDTLFNLWSPKTTSPCIKDTLIAIIFESSIIPEFDLDTNYCQLTMDTIFLNPNSNNALTGEWNIPYFVPGQITGVDLLINYQPADSFCAEPLALSIDIDSAMFVNFSIPSTLCSNQGIFTFPIFSNEGIQGIWLEPNLDLSTLNGSYSNYFIADEECYYDFEFNFEVLNIIEANFSNLDSLCSDLGIINLDPISTNGIEGYWTPASIDLDTLTTNSVDAIWIPLDDLNGCISTVVKRINIFQPIQASFSFDLTYCSSSPDTLFLPSESLEGYLGEWNVPFIIPADQLLPNLEINFTPSQMNCSHFSTYQLEFTEELEVNFDLASVYCNNANPLALANNSLDGILGSWNINPIEFESLVGAQIAVFTPDQSCTKEFVFEFEVYPFQENNFNISESLCRIDSLIILDPYSIEDHEGTWTPSSINPTNISADYIILLWTPLDDQNPCLVDTTIRIDFIETQIPVFSFATFYCSMDPMITLPNLSDNNIMGTWTLGDINPMDYSNEMISTTFQIDDANQCIIDVIIDIFIAENITPNFDLPSYFCSYDQVFTLPIISDNGVAGMWNISSIDPINYLGDTLDLIFTPDNLTCASTFLHRMEIINRFDLQALVEFEDECDFLFADIIIIGELTDLEFSIDNGISWQSDACFKMLPEGNYQIIARSTLFPNCQSLLTADIVIVESVVIQDLIINNISDCGLMDGRIEILATGENLEYSFDGGISWSDNPILGLLNIGTYDLVVRSKDLINCSVSDQVVLIQADLPVLISITPTNPNNCQASIGQFTLNMENSSFGNFEYSIDNGMSWQTGNSFNNLSAGIYNISIRLINHPNCIIQESITLLEDQQDLLIPQYQINQLSECDANDGMLLIDNNNGLLEFSIDGGMSWQSDSQFNNLAPGPYTIILRRITAINCDNSFDFNIDTWICPCTDLVIDYLATPSYCIDTQSGTIEILAISGSDDPNLIWESGSNNWLLSALETGWYYYTVNYEDNCSWTDSIFLDYIDPISFGLQSFDESCPNSEDGIIEVIEANGGLSPYSYSLDGEVYQDENIFYNLSPDEYQVFILDQNNCIKSEFIGLFSNPGIGILLPDIISLEFNSSIFLNPLIDQTTIDSFVWSPSEYILNPGELVAEVAPSESIEYTLTIFFDECIENRKVLVEVIDDSSLYLGTAFSPNGDGNNDIFFIQSNENKAIDIQSFEIFDRWGNLVFNIDKPQLNQPEDGWRGLVNGDYAIPGVYVYKIKTSLNDQKEIYFGQITLIR